MSIKSILVLFVVSSMIVIGASYCKIESIGSSNLINVGFALGGLLQLVAGGLLVKFLIEEGKNKKGS